MHLTRLGFLLGDAFLGFAVLTLPLGPLPSCVPFSLDSLKSEPLRKRRPESETMRSSVNSSVE